MLYFLWRLAAFIVTISILITAHEFGHFWAARRCGVMVERFSIGFGRVLWRQRDKRGTEHVIAAIPLGGYVKMLDERLNTVTPERHNETFNHKPIWQRSAIIAAGPACNFLFAIFSYWLVFMIGVPRYRPVIGDIAPHSIAAQAEISPGMELKSVNGIETPDWDSVRLQIISKIGDDEITFSVAPFGVMQSERKTLNLSGWQFEPDKQDAIVALGIIPLSPQIEPVLAEVQKGSAAMKAGLKAGDRIAKVDSQPITEWQLFATKIRDNPDRPLKVSIERQGKNLDITLWPEKKLVSKGVAEGFAGVVPTLIPLPTKYRIMRQYGPLPALLRAGEKTWQLIRLTAGMLGKLVTGDIHINNLSGPISIAKSAGTSATYGLMYYLMFLAMISINLGIINLFPLPVLDGGHLLFLIIEKLKGEPVSTRIQSVSYRIGSILLVLLIGLSLFNDLSRL